MSLVSLSFCANLAFSTLEHLLVSGLDYWGHGLIVCFSDAKL